MPEKICWGIIFCYGLYLSVLENNHKASTLREKPKYLLKRISTYLADGLVQQKRWWKNINIKNFENK